MFLFDIQSMLKYIVHNNKNNNSVHYYICMPINWKVDFDNCGFQIFVEISPDVSEEN